MRCIDKLVYSEVIQPILLALLVLTSLIFGRELGNISSLLISKAVDWQTILLICLSLLPNTLIFTLPLSVLIGTLVGISRLSSDNEIIALKAGGINLLSLLAPVVFIASICCLFNFLISLYFLPIGNNQLRLLKFQISSDIIPQEIRARVFVEDFPDVIFYADDLDDYHSQLRGIFLFDQSDTKEQNLVISQMGRLLVNKQERKLQLHLQNGLIYKMASSGLGIRESVSTFASSDLPISLKDAATALREKNHTEKTTTELLESLESSNGEKALLHRIEFHKRLALPIATLVFAFLAPSLAVTTRKSGRYAGFLVAIIAVLSFYSLFQTGMRLAAVEKVPVFLGVWLADFVFVGIALALAVYTNQEVNLFGHVKNLPFLRYLGKSWQIWPKLNMKRPGNRVSRLMGYSNLPPPRYRAARIIDSYVAQGIISHFLLATAGCCSLFIILTLFDLADDIARQQSSFMLVLSYFWFLLPQILVLVLPLSTLIAILVHYATWEKTSQVLAFKAGGVSLFRLAVPALLVACGLSLGNYLLQESILPYSNKRQDSLRNIIKGRSQTSFKIERKWILGESNQIYNYRYFDSNQNVFIGINVFVWDRRDYRLLKRIAAERAIWNGTSWDMVSGWERSYSTTESRLEKFERRSYSFPEKPSYFRREIFDPKESSKMTYMELKEQIEVLQKSGYSATALQVELHKKIAFPMACLIMSLVAVPFAFSLGRRGALGGMAISIALGISYWAALSLFEATGDYGLLSPGLAAWAPNIIFGGGGLYLFLGMRT